MEGDVDLVCTDKEWENGSAALSERLRLSLLLAGKTSIVTYLLKVPRDISIKFSHQFLSFMLNWCLN